MKLREKKSKRRNRDRRQLRTLESLETRSMLTTCTGLCGDLNFDGNVDFDDFTTLAANFGSSGDGSQGDFSGDGRIDFADFLVLSASFDTSANEGEFVSPGSSGEFTPGAEPDTGSIVEHGEQGSATEEGVETTAGEINFVDAPGAETGPQSGLGRDRERDDEEEDEDDRHENDRDDDEKDDDKRDNDVLRATKLIQQGKTYSLSYILENDSPTNPFVSHNVSLDLVLRLPSDNEFVALAETVTSNFMHVGTQFDALGHIGIGDEFYGGNTFDDVYSESGLLKLGVEEVDPFFTRGVLVDVARYKGVEMLPPTYEITLDDLKGALKLQKTKIHKGDVVLFHTGWGSNYISNPDVFVATQPGIGVEVAQSLASRDVVMVGADNVFVEVFPNPDQNLVLPVHQELLTKNGIHLLEIVKTDELANDRVYEFAFVFAPILVKGATGSAAHPIAII